MPSRRSLVPEAVLAYLSRYTHRVAISNQRLIGFDETGITFRYKDYRRDGPERQRVMTLAPHEFIRRFLLHVLPHGFHRIRHYGLLASSARKANIARARELLAVAPPPEPVEAPEPLRLAPALSLLRWPHDHRRNVWAMAATTRATARARTNREQHVVTRHGLRLLHAATPPLRRMPPGASFARISATGLDISRGQLPIHDRLAKNITHQAPANARAEPAAKPPQPSKTRNPHRPSPQPRGFVLGRFPYAGPVPRRATGDGRHPKTFTIARHSTTIVDFSKAGIHGRNLVITITKRRSFAASAAAARLRSQTVAELATAPATTVVSRQFIQQSLGVLQARRIEALVNQL